MKSKIKTFVCRIVLIVLYRALKVLVRKESRVEREFRAFKDGYTIKISLFPKDNGFFMKKENGRLLRIKSAKDEDVSITFKSVDTAFLVFTGMMGLSRAYSEHRFSLKGDIRETMALVRIIEIAESYLFPPIMNRRILRAIPKKERSSISVYRMVLLGF